MGKMSKMITKLNYKAQKVQYQARKKAPLLLTLAGCAGLCGTAYLAYRARHEVEEILTDVEERQSQGEHVPATQTAVRVGLALGPTIVAGGLSLAAIAGAYHVLTNRVTLLSSALVAAHEESRKYKEYIRENHPGVPLSADGKLEKVYRNEEESKTEGAVKVVAINRDKLAGTERVFFDLSDEYVSDDNLYNQMFIENASHILNNMLISRGFLRLSEVYSALKIPSSSYNIKNAELLGWTSSTYFDLNTTIINVTDKEGYAKPVPCVDWPSPVPIYNDIDYSKVVAEYNY